MSSSFRLWNAFKQRAYSQLHAQSSRLQRASIQASQHRTSTGSSRSGWQWQSHSSSRSQFGGAAFGARFQWRGFTRGFTSGARRLGARYSALLEEYPYTTNCVTSGLLGFAGDATTQALEHRWDEESQRTPKPWDWRRLFAVSFFGVAFMGPIGHVWYQYLEKFCVRYCSRKASSITVKVCGDTFLFGPVCLWAFFVSVSLMEGTPWRRTEQKIRRDFVPTYLVDYSIWPIIQGLNFRFVPVRHQLLYVNAVCYVDDIFLSYVQHNNLPRIFQLIEDWWERVLDSGKYEWCGVTREGLDELTQWEEDQDKARELQWQREHPQRVANSDTSIGLLRFTTSADKQQELQVAQQAERRRNSAGANSPPGAQ